MRTCSIQGCYRVHEARGWCSLHYERWKRHGDPMIAGRPVVERAAGKTTAYPTCSVERCNRPHKGHGYCTLHYQRFKKHGDPLLKATPKGAAPKGRTCAVDGCARGHEAKGFCGLHYRRWKAYGDPLLGKEWRGAARKCGEGHWVCVSCERCLPAEAFNTEARRDHPKPRCRSCTLGKEAPEPLRGERISRDRNVRWEEESRELLELAVAWFIGRGVTLADVAALTGLPGETIVGWREGKRGDRAQVERVTDLWRLGLEPVHRRLRGAALVAALERLEIAA